MLGVVLRTVPPTLERSEGLMKNISDRVRKTDRRKQKEIGEDWQVRLEECYKCYEKMTTFLGWGRRESGGELIHSFLSFRTLTTFYILKA